MLYTLLIALAIMSQFIVAQAKDSPKKSFNQDRYNEFAQKFKQQSFREGTGRWANRGGSRREWFSCYYSALSAGAGKSEAAAHADKMHPPA